MAYNKRKKYIITRDSLIYYDDSPIIGHNTAMGIVKEKEATELGFVWGCRVATSQDLERIEEYNKILISC
jgi:hypothetical protein